MPGSPTAPHTINNRGFIMNKISEHFDRAEFACKCGCGYNTVDVILLLVLEDVRDRFKSPVRINSGCRCLDHNEDIGGSKNSQHVLGRAADTTVDGVSPEEVYEYLSRKYPTRYGMSCYDTFVHIDTRSNKSRW
jgi:uncharacterized protein YcbK (DUF882 family)